MTTNLSNVMYLPTYNQRIPGTDIEICGKNQVVTLNENEPPVLYHTSVSHVADFMKKHLKTLYDEIYEIIPLDYDKYSPVPQITTTEHFMILKKHKNLYDLPDDMVHSLPQVMRMNILKTVIDDPFLEHSCLRVLQDDPDVFVRRKLALYTLNRDQLIHLCGDKEPCVRAAILERRVWEPELIRILTNDCNDRVKTEAIKKLKEIKEAEEEYHRSWMED